MPRIIIIITTCMLLSSTYSLAQWKVGGNFGAGKGPIKDAYNFSFGADAYYVYRNPDALFRYGLNGSLLVLPGYETNNRGVITKHETATYLPLSFILRLTFFKVLTVGPDMGYALSLNGSIPNGLYLKGIVGLDIANDYEVNLYYSEVATGNGNNYSSFGVGFLVHIF